MEMHAQNVICGPQKKKIKKKIIFSQVIHKKPKKYNELTPGDPNYYLPLFFTIWGLSPPFVYLQGFI